MKQTKNALHMLMRAYSAVFKSAFIKGMATAVVLTAGLAAGAANAAWDGSFNVPSDAENVINVISGNAANYKKITDADAVLTFSGAALTADTKYSIYSASGASAEATNVADVYITGTSGSGGLQAFHAVNGGKITNAGDIYIKAEGDFGCKISSMFADGSEGSAIVNNGNIYVNNATGMSFGSTSVNASAVNNGTIEVVSGGVGMVNAAAGTGISMTNAGTINAAGNNSVGVSIRDGASGTTFTNTGTISADDDSYAVLVGAGASAVSGSGGVYSATVSSFTSGNTVIFDGEVASGKVFIAESNALQVKNVQNGTLDLVTFTQTSGGTTISGGVGVSLTDSDITLDGTEAKLNLDTLALTNSDLDISAKKEVTVKSLTVEGTSSLSNAGVLTISKNADLSSATFTNTGTINASGDLTVQNLSSLYQASGATVNFSGSTLKVTGADQIDVSDVSLSASAKTLDAAKSEVTIASGYAAKFNTITAGELEVVSGSNTFDITSGSSITVLDGLTFTKQENIIAVLSEQEDKAFTINVSGDLTFGNAESAGAKLDQNYNVTGSGSIAVEGGEWSVLDVTLNSSATGGAALTIDNGASFTANSLTVISGAVNVNAGSLDAGTLTVASGASITVGDGTSEASLSISNVGEAGMSGSITANNLATIEIDKTVVDAVSSGSGWNATGVTANAGSTVKLDLGDATYENASGAKAVISKIVGGLPDGLIDIGDATISGLDANNNGVIDDSDVSELGNITSTQMKAYIRYTSGGTVNGGSWNGIASDSYSVIVTGTTVISANDGHFAWHAEDPSEGLYGYVGTDANITISGSGSVLTLEGAGTAGNISGTSGNNNILNLGSDQKLGEITTLKQVNVNGTGTSATKINVTELNVNAGSSFAVTNEEGNAQSTFETLNVDGTFIADDVTVNTTSGNTSSGINVTGLLDAGSISITTSGARAEFYVTDGGKVVADAITTTSTTKNGLVLYVGDETSAGTLEVGKLSLNHGRLFVGSDFESPASVVAITNLDGTNEKYADDVQVDGDFILGMNSIVGVGISEADLRAAVSPYMAGSSLTEDLASILYLNDVLELTGVSRKIYIDSTKTGDALEQAWSGASTLFYLGENSALVISDDAVQKLDSDTYLINFSGARMSGSDVEFGENSQIIVDSGFVAGETLNLISDSNGGVDLTNGDNNDNVTITAAGGLVDGTLQNDGTILFSYDKAKGEKLLTKVSSPVKGLIHEVFGAEIAANDGAGYQYIKNTGANKGGQSVEGTARLAVYAGAVQATYMAQQTSTDAVADRLGMANPNSNLVYADNLKGGGIWLAPVYKNHDSDEFDAQGVDYGADIDLYGVALGADFTTESGVRVGAYFNVGAGDADGQGVGDEVSNDFDYFGLGIYAGMNFGNFGLIADAGFTQVSNDIDQNSYLGKVTADTDTTAVTVGLRGEYKFETQYVDITPHLGVRYTNLDMDSYDAKMDGEIIATTSADNMQIFSIPFGVTFAKEFTSGDWSVKPVFDITLTANAGDTDFDMDTTFIGTKTLNLSTEVMDDFTYGGTLGIDAKYGQSLGFGINVNYVGSDSADEFGVTGNIRYMF